MSCFQSQSYPHLRLKGSINRIHVKDAMQSSFSICMKSIVLYTPDTLIHLQCLCNPALYQDVYKRQDYTFTSDIDSDTYNQIKLVRPNKETGQGDTYVFNDSATIAKWGLLQKYEKVDENLNEAQISEQGKIMMAYYDRVLKTISASGVAGVVGLRAGMMSMFRIAEIPELQRGYFLLLEKVKHKFSSDDHTMNVEAKVLTI